MVMHSLREQKDVGQITASPMRVDSALHSLEAMVK